MSEITNWKECQTIRKGNRISMWKSENFLMLDCGDLANHEYMKNIWAMHLNWVTTMVCQTYFNEDFQLNYNPNIQDKYQTNI